MRSTAEEFRAHESSVTCGRPFAFFLLARENLLISIDGLKAFALNFRLCAVSLGTELDGSLSGFFR